MRQNTGLCCTFDNKGLKMAALKQVLKALANGMKHFITYLTHEATKGALSLTPT
jgi:hypothetical protein